MHLGPIKLTHVSLLISLPPEHFQSVSTFQFSSHPSRFRVLPSSHSSWSSLYPLPHISIHELVKSEYL